MIRTSTFLALLLIATASLAQTATTQAPPPAASAGTAAAPATARRQPQAKTKEEFEAYNAAASKTDAAQMEAAADEFAQKFPNSELKELLYVRTMSIYQQQNNSAKVVTTGRKAIAAGTCTPGKVSVSLSGNFTGTMKSEDPACPDRAMPPANPVPLVAVASALVMDTRESDLDRDARYAEAGKDAKSALDNIDTGLQIPPGVPPESVAAAKANLRSIAYDTLGVIAMNKKDYASAEQNFQQAADLMKSQPDAVVYLRLSVAQDNQNKYPQALDSANKAVQYAPDGSAEKNLAKQQQDRLQKLIAEKAPSAPPTPQPH